MTDDGDVYVRKINGELADDVGCSRPGGDGGPPGRSDARRPRPARSGPDRNLSSYSQGTLSYFMQRHLCRSVPSEVFMDSTEEGSPCI